MEALGKVIGIREPEGPSEAERAAQTRQLTQAKREEMAAKAAADAAAATGSVKQSLAYTGNRKDKLGG